MYANTQSTSHRAETGPGPQLRPRSKRVTWSAAAPWSTSRRRKVALLRETPDGWVLQHVRTITVSQRAPSECTIDTEPALEDLPAAVRARLPDDLEVSDGV